jgi:hypothetical protein
MSSTQISTAQVSVGTSPTQLVSARPGRKKLYIHISSAPSGFVIGNSSVTASTGANPDSFVVNGATGIVLGTSAEIWAVSPNGSTIIDIAELHD